MSSEAPKPWDRPWTTEDLIGQASNWNLAGDVGLLRHLESLSETIITKCTETHNGLNKLLDDLDKTSLQLDVVKNEFFSLHNTQFIESRVYEEDETLPEETETAQKKPEEKAPTDEERKRDIKEALQRGLDVLDRYFDKVEVSVSDSEDDANIPSYVLRPKDLYIDRPLPYVIGSEEWYKKVHVGLEETSSESETDKISEKFSESDSESELPVSNRSRIKAVSDSSSEDFSNKLIGDHPVANSTISDASKVDFAPSSDSDGTNSLPAQVPISNVSFAEQLAAKLGNVIENVPEEEVNTKPIKKVTDKPQFGGLFFDEPPPLDESDDLFNRTAKTGLFSTGKGLFDDDDEDETYWGQKQNEPKSVVKPTSSFTDSLDKVEKVVKPDANTGSIFDDDFSDDDLFSANKSDATKKSYLQPFKRAPPIFDDEPPALESEPVKKKKPVGGVAVLGENLFDNAQKVLPNMQKSSIDFKNVSDNNQSAITDVPKKKSLFDDDTGDADFDIADKTKVDNISKPVDRLVDNEGDVRKDVSDNKQARPVTKKISLFDDGDDDDFDITNTVKVDKVDSKPNSRFVDDKGNKTKEVDDDKHVKTNLFHDAVDDANKNTADTKTGPKKISLFDDDFEDNLFERDLFSDVNVKKFTSSLFDDEPLSNDLFSPRNIQDQSKSVGIDSFDDKSSTKAVKDEPEEKSETTKAAVSLFDSNPPPDLDDWDTKSDNNLFVDEPLSYDASDYSQQRVSLFDNEPPLLFSDESSGIVKDQTTRGGSDVSFAPEASSSRRLSSDIFSEQQSNDSFFLTKNSSERPSQRPLQSISEVSRDNNEPSNVVDNVLSSKSQSLFSFDNDDDLEGDLFVSNDTSKVSDDTSKNTTKNLDDSTRTIKTEDVDVRKAPVAETVDRESETPPQKVSPGKLKHNLNINVEALKPGFVPPKKDVIVKSHSLDIHDKKTDCDDVLTKSISSVDVKKIDNNSPPEKSLGFEEVDDTVETLHSYTKDRVRIPIKRRPSSRRGRKELMKKSGDDFKIAVDTDKTILDDESLLKKIDSDITEKAQNVTSDSDVQKIVTEVAQNYLKSTKDEGGRKKTIIESIDDSKKDTDGINEDYEDVTISKSEDVKSDTESKSTSTVVKSDSHLFSGSDDDDDLFGGFKKAKPTVMTTTTSSKIAKKDTSVGASLFDSPDSDNDLFGPTKKAPATKNLLSVATETKERRPSVVKSDDFATPEFDKPELFADNDDDDDDIFSTKKLPPKSDIFKKSLFGDDPDDDEDDDIFSTGTTIRSTKSAEQSKTVMKKSTTKTSGLRKLDNTETLLEDPLDALKK